MFTSALVKAEIGTGHEHALFIENKGQWHEIIKYKMELRHGALFFENDALTYHLRDVNDWEDKHGANHNHHDIDENRKVTSFAFQAKWKNANLKNRQFTKGQMPDYRNYIIGNDQSKWTSNVKKYQHLTYSNIYNGIDLEFYGVGDNLKYNWLLAPNADPSQIITAYSTNVPVSIVKGDLWIEAPTGKIVEKAPIVFQEINGVRKYIKAAYVINGNEVSFSLGKYDKNFPLIIDPTIEFSSYSGATVDNWGFTATYDDDGNLYGAGIVFGIGYPITPDNIQSGFNNRPPGPGQTDPTTDIGLTKFSSDGSTLLYSTYIGGAGIDQPHSMIVNSNDELVMFGTTGSLNFPVPSNGYRTTHGGGNNTSVTGFYSFKRTDMFVLKLNSAGNAMLSGTFLGGSDNDGINKAFSKNYGDRSRGEVVVDDQDNVYIASSSASINFPTSSSATQKIKANGQDAVIVKLNSNLSMLLWGTYFGGNLDDVAYSLTISPNGDIYACGSTMSSDLDSTSTGLLSTYSGTIDGWVARFSGATGALKKATYIGTSSYDQAFIIDSDKNNGIYVFGQTLGNYPVSANVYSNPNSGQFIQKLSPDLSTSLMSTVVGAGNGINIVPTAFNVDNCLNIMLSGWGGDVNGGSNFMQGNTRNMPITSNAYQSTTDGSDFYFMVLDYNATSLAYATYFGGNVASEHVDGGTSRFSPDGNIYQAVCAGCNNGNFPTTAGAWSQTNNSPSIGGNSGCNLGVIKMNFETSIKAEIDVDWSMDIDTTCKTLTIDFGNKSKYANKYIWDLGNGTITNDVAPIGFYDSFGTYTVKLIAIDTICDISDTVEVSFVHDKGIQPVADFDINYVSCDLERKVSITNNSRNGANAFLWEFGDGTSSRGFNPNHNYNTSGVYTVTLIALDTSCNTSDTITRNVYFDYDIPAPEIELSANPCGDGSLSVIYENDSTWYTYRWEYSDGFVETNKYPTHKFGITGNYSIHLVIKDSLCNSSFEYNFADYFLIAEERLYIPNAFTPNGDVNNEEFVISGNTCLENSEFIILNSFGEEIFRTQKPFEEFWDGTVNGQPAQDDVYVYRFTSDLINKTGYIVLYH